MKPYPFVTSIPKAPGVYRADRAIYAYKQFRQKGPYGPFQTNVKQVEIPAGAIIVVSGASKFRVSALVFNFKADRLRGPYRGIVGTYRKGYNVPHALSLNTKQICAPGLHACRTKEDAHTR